MTKRFRSNSSEDRLLDDKELSEAVSAMHKRIIQNPASRIEVLVQILNEMKLLKEPELTDQMTILKLVIKKGFLQRDLEAAISIVQYRKRGT